MRPDDLSVCDPTNQPTETIRTRSELCDSLIDLVNTKSEHLTNIGFSPQMARFDCLFTIKMIVDKLFEECDVGSARHDWYREFVSPEMFRSQLENDRGG